MTALIVFSIKTKHGVTGFKEETTVTVSPISHLVWGLIYV